MAPDDDEDESVKKWRVVTGSSLIGCPGVRVQSGDTVTEVKPPEDGYVMVATEDGKKGSLPVSCVGEQSVIIIISLTLHSTDHLQRSWSEWSGAW